MSDLGRWELRGPVQTLRTQWAEWNPETGDWWPLKNRFVAMFRPDGQLSEIEHHNPDGSMPRDVRVYDESGRLTEEQWWAHDELTRRILHTYDVGGRPTSSVTVDVDGTERDTELCRYDDHGRKTTVVLLRVPESGDARCSAGSGGTMHGVEGTDVAYSAPGATTSTTTYDERALPAEVTFRDASDAVVCRVVFSRDQEGRALSERMELAGLEGQLGRAIDAYMPTDERASVTALLEAVFEGHTFALATYAYDEKGRRIESVRRIGTLSEERVTVRYDDFDNPVEEVRLERSRDIRMDDGAVKGEDMPSCVQRVRFEYRYDAYGNWTERIVWQRTEPNADERPSNIERRSITYDD